MRKKKKLHIKLWQCYKCNVIYIFLSIYTCELIIINKISDLKCSLIMCTLHIKVAVLSFKPEIRLRKVGLVPNAWANQMSVNLTSIPNLVFMPMWWGSSFISSFNNVAVTLMNNCIRFKSTHIYTLVPCMHHTKYIYVRKWTKTYTQFQYDTL